MNQMARPPLANMTANEFLAWPGDESGRKFHLIDGEVLAVSPANRMHGEIQANLAYLLTSATRGSVPRLRAVTEAAIIPALTAGDNVRVPDLVVSGLSQNARDQVVEDPVVIVEILSPGNKAVTRDNVRAYATLASVQAIVVVHTSRMEVEVSRRDVLGDWSATPAIFKAGARLVLPSIGLDCPVEEVYADTMLARPARG